jgi:hypothetical protein
MPDLIPFVDRDQYFVVHAARQTGKTTAMRDLAARLRHRGDVAVWATLEESQGVEDTADAEPIWIRSIHDAAWTLPETHAPPPAQPFIDREPRRRLRAFLTAWAGRLDRPLSCCSTKRTWSEGPRW